MKQARDDDVARDEAKTFWDELYRDRDTADERPNPLLVETVEPLPSGAALDLGCGGGDDTVWLARRGWQVTAVDISTVAADRVRDRAQQLGLGHRVVTNTHHPTPAEIAAELDLDPEQWPVVCADAPQRRAAGSPGHTSIVTDHVLTLRRSDR